MHDRTTNPATTQAHANAAAPPPAWTARLSTRVFLALVIGAVAGGLLQLAGGADAAIVRAVLPWIDVVGVGYVRLLQLVVSPLVFVAILSAVVRLHDAGDTRTLGVAGASVVGTLLVTTAIAAGIGVAVAHLFALRADALVQGAREVARGAALVAKQDDATALTLPALLQSLVPTNAVADLAGMRPTSVAGVVLFAVLLGVAAIALRRDDPEAGARVVRGVETLQALVLRLVRLVVRLTPWGVAALATRVVATARAGEIAQLGTFVVASYVGLAAVLVVHLALAAVAGVGPARYVRRAWPALAFAFTSRSSAATLPLTVDVQVAGLGVPSVVASLAASIGTTLGQNGCAGLYPAMLAVMIAPSAGVDPSAPSFVGAVVVAATLGSVGIAGVGGGATFAALVVLSTLGLPVALAGVLIAIEPLIDMGRTAINVSGALVAGTVTARVVARATPRARGSTTTGHTERTLEPPARGGRAPIAPGA